MDEFRNQAALEPYFAQSFGCVFFKQVAKGGIFFVGGAFGQGDIYLFNTVNGELAMEKVKKVDLMQASAGWILGGEVYSEIIFFESEKDYQNFSSGTFEFGADAKVVALTAAASAKVTTMGNTGIQMGLNASDTEVRGVNVGAEKPEYTKGMKVFTLTLGGLMYQATVAGQKFNIKPL